MLVINQVGLAANLVDMGRKHAQIDGYSQSGALDWFNYTLANAICGNPLNNVAIEVMGGGFSMTMLSDCAIAITGAATNVYVNDSQIKLNTVYQLRREDKLEIGEVKCGLFNYIALSGQISAPTFRASVCAVKREKSGGFTNTGVGLQQGDNIGITNIKRISSENAAKHLGNCHLSTSEKRTGNHANFLNKTPNLAPVLTQHLQAQLTSRKEIPMQFSYQHSYFHTTQKHLFLSRDYDVTQYLDKMGIRLSGRSVQCSITTLNSQPIAIGAIQIAGDGKPIIMRNDRQTIGGYPIIGVVNCIGLSFLSQAVQGDSIRFINISVTDAIVEKLLIWRQFEAISLQQQILMT